MRNTRKNRGFTLVELLVVVVVISILATIVLSVNKKIQAQTRDSERDNDITVVAEALEDYHRRHGAYPAHTQMGDADGETVKELLDLDSTTALVSPSEAGENATTSYLATNNCAESGSQDGFDQELHYSYCTISPCTMDFCSGYQIMYFYEEGSDDMVTVSGRQNT